MERLKRKKQKRSSFAIIKNSTLRITVLLVIIGLNWTGLSAVIETFGYYNDTENASGVFTAATLDFYLDSSANFSPPDLSPGESASREIIFVNNGNFPKYIIEADDFSSEICNYLTLEANLDGGDFEYLGSLTEFDYGPIPFEEPEIWSFILTLSAETPGNLLGEECQFKFIFQGSQIKNDLPFGQGFNDIEDIDNNVGAKVCYDVDIRSMGYWKNHSEVYIPYLPQYLGGYPEDEIIDTVAKVNQIFDADNSVMRNKLKKQLLAMKFNIAHFDIGEYIPPSATGTLNQIVAEADDLLREETEPSLEEMKTLLDNLNNMPDFRHCTVPKVKVLVPNGGETWWVGRSYDLEWETADLDCPDDSVVDIWYSRDSGGTFANIVKGTENDDVYNWRIPLFLNGYYVPSDRARIKVVARCSENLMVAGWDISDEDFCPPIDYSLLTPEEIESLIAMGLYEEPTQEETATEEIPALEEESIAEENSTISEETPTEAESTEAEEDSLPPVDTTENSTSDEEITEGPLSPAVQLYPTLPSDELITEEETPAEEEAPAEEVITEATPSDETATETTTEIITTEEETLPNEEPAAEQTQTEEQPVEEQPVIEEQPAAVEQPISELAPEVTEPAPEVTETTEETPAVAIEEMSVLEEPSVIEENSTEEISAPEEQPTIIEEPVIVEQPTSEPAPEPEPDLSNSDEPNNE